MTGHWGGNLGDQIFLAQDRLFADKARRWGVNVCFIAPDGSFRDSTAIDREFRLREGTSVGAQVTTLGSDTSTGAGK